MPQMAPLWWSILFIMFIISLMATYSNLYFLWMPSNTSSIVNKNMEEKVNWKW
uniref:ATP synthase complex subunit 8 n=1 Tax=Alloeorhynchus bakeri TaxID=796621 RepID=G9B4I6_9HEMI|nr:ATP synthase F0 subunit 8 [Alloeorhynchus bakeri]ADI75222.1 ATP synthase F0 subunit 8 [Alloeorhynchus bakeri]